MTSYKILLVDDEIQMTERMKTAVLAHGGFTVVGAATNGLDALEHIDKSAPDVVITDIRMPFLDGIGLTRIIRRDHPSIKVTFVSGYDEFAYAQEAIQLDVYQYLTKPVSKSDIQQFLDDLKDQLDADQARLYNEEKLRASVERSKPLLIERTFNTVLFEDPINPQTLTDLQSYGIPLEAKAYTVLVLELERTMPVQERDNISIFLSQTFKESFIAYPVHHLFNVQNYLVGLLGNQRVEQSELELVINAWILQAQTIHDTKIRVGISRTFETLTTLNPYFLEAEEALKHNLALNIGPLVFFDDMPGKNESNMVGLNLLHAEIEETLRYGDTPAIELLFSRMRNIFLRNEKPVVNAQHLMIDVRGIILRLMDTIDPIKTDAIQLDDIFETNDIERFIDQAERIVLDLHALKKKALVQKSHQKIDTIIRFIDAHYDDPDMQLELLCDKFSISVSYLSSLFKKKTGLPVHKYVTQKRLAAAKHLLKFTPDTITEVAAQIGYRDVYHFSYTFKKNMGMSPKEYRDG